MGAFYIFFLTEVRRLVARVRRIKNMIRDVEDAANAHGEDESIYLSHFHLVFEDIQNDAVQLNHIQNQLNMFELNIIYLH